MNESERLAVELDKALNGCAWHGPSIREAVEGVDRVAALGRPVSSAHSIAEIVLHVTTWNDVVRRRLGGETPQVPDSEDWPPADFADDGAWQEAVRRLQETGRALCETVRTFPVERLHENRPRIDDTWYGLISGGVQHVAYHAGQVAVLKKSRAGR